METKSIVQVTVAVLVAVVVFTTVLIPITNTATAETLEYHNTGAYFVEPDGNEHTIYIDPATKSVLVDGINVAYPDMTYGSSTLAFGADTEAWILRIESGGRLVFAGPTQQWRTMGNGPHNIHIAGDGTTSVTYDGVTQSRSGTTMYLSDKGDHVLATNPYITEDTQIYAPISARFAPGDTVDLFELVSGTPDNLTATACRYIDSNLTPDQQTIATTTFAIEKSNGSGNLYRVDAIKQHVESEAGSVKDVTITLLIVPESIEYNNPAYTGSTNAALIGIIPVLVIVGLILAVVGVAIVRRYDL